MSRRTVPIDPSIGERIRARRELRKWSLRHAASRAGVAPSTWMRVENGELRTDRYLVSDFAVALECSVADLTGQPHLPADRQLEAAHARVPRIWQTLVEIAPDEPPNRPGAPLAELERRVELLDDRCWRLCDYAAAGQLLPDLLADLHAAAGGPDGHAALSLMVKATYAATLTLRNLGYVAECAFAAERCRQVAERLGDPAALALADFVRAQSAVAGGSFRRSLTLATRAATELDRHTGAPAVVEVLGMLHLTSALSVMADGSAGLAIDHVAEAERLAARTGETTSWSLSFGPTNVAIWRVGIEVAAGNPGRAVEVARSVNPALLPSMARQSAYYLDFARALTDVDADQEAVRMLLTAERLAPQRIRPSVAAREAGRFLLHRSRREAGGSALRGLCERLGVDVG